MSEKITQNFQNISFSAWEKQRKKSVGGDSSIIHPRLILSPTALGSSFIPWLWGKKKSDF